MKYREHKMVANWSYKNSSFALVPLKTNCYNEFKNNKVVIKMDPEMMQMTARLAELTVRNTASVVFEKISVSKAKKSDKETIAELTDIIKELIDEKQELEFISQAFERELATQKLSDNDIKFVGETVLPVIKDFASKSEGDNRGLLQSIEMMEPLISQNTLQVLQILGFNFKKAIGEPFTELLSKKIQSLHVENNESLIISTAERDTEFYKVLQNNEAFNRLQQLSDK
ncbi:MAG: hypothetical protein LKJ07_07350 [Leuconostoc mesenteroides]|jgi:hypothetical protein|uniref:hypothetical protein n=1 Tax=Leuconostoc mesenteroides TaxID=1245 RepID=UPI00235E5330|nr:hypothetical protein [Leuconostoc mesenteroides]MCH3934330.1 hypothetical protein [Leuconostoc mesenteroides]MCI1878503.1 hypothetical protein [Leuconostoc mesenteroides]MCI1908044.1 hypothetical protein [Leuconostoc mesenteroides]